MKKDRTANEAEFARVLLPLARRWRAEADHAVAEFGLSDATGWVLLHVFRLGDGVRQGELATAVDIQGASLVRLVDQLERAGLVERRVDAQDRRANRVLLTENGRAMAGRIEQALGLIRREMFEGIGDAELASAKAVLNLLAERVAERRGKRG
jgi:MarR family transcriptional regulator for hemolysin